MSDFPATPSQAVSYSAAAEEQAFPTQGADGSQEDGRHASPRGDIAALPRRLETVPADLIDVDEHQIRARLHLDKEFLASVRLLGVLQPVLLLARAGGRFLLIAGHRRFAAARQVGLTAVPAEIIDADLSEFALLKLRHAENEKRQPLSFSDRARAYEIARERGMTQKEVGEFFGVAQSVVSDHLTVLHGPEGIRRRVEAGLSVKQGAKLLRRRKNRRKPPDVPDGETPPVAQPPTASNPKVRGPAAGKHVYATWTDRESAIRLTAGGRRKTPPSRAQLIGFLRRWLQDLEGEAS